MPRYSSPWVSLSEAVTSLTTVGMTKNDAKADLCRALADNQIEFRALVEIAKEDDGLYPGSKGEKIPERHWLSCLQARVPLGLELADLEWDQSRPKIDWLTTFNETIDEDHRIGSEPECRTILRLEVLASDLACIFPSVAQEANEEFYALPKERPPESRRQEREAYGALLKKYPDRKIPKQSIQEIANNLRTARGEVISRDAVRRVLGQK